MQKTDSFRTQIEQVYSGEILVLLTAEVTFALKER